MKIEALGTTVAIGNLEDADFITTTFAGADAVYCMISMSFSVDNHHAYLHNIAENYVQAIKR